MITSVDLESYVSFLASPYSKDEKQQSGTGYAAVHYITGKDHEIKTGKRY